MYKTQRIYNVGGLNMNIESFKSWIDGLSIKNAREVNQALGTKLHVLANKLTEALPADLRKKYGQYNTTSDIVWNGGCTFFLYDNVGLDITDDEKEELFENARHLLQPIVLAWMPLGVVLEKIIFSPNNNGLIEAHFALA